MKKITPEEVLATPTCFRQHVNLPSAQVAGLSDDELAAALCFEIEPFSGIPRAKGRLAWKRVNAPDAARAVFDVVQVRTSDLLDEVARARKAKRVIRAVTAVPEAAAGETLETLPWIAVKASGGLHVRLSLLAACAAVLAVLAVGWDYVALQNDATRLAREVTFQRLLQDEREALNAKIAAVQRETSALRTQRMDAARAQQNAEVLRAAWRVFLEAVPSACTDESVLKNLQATGAYSVHLTGLALSADAATRTFVRLSEALKPPKSGWQLTPGAIEAPANGGTVTFECDLVFDPEGQFK